MIPQRITSFCINTSPSWHIELILTTTYCPNLSIGSLAYIIVAIEILDGILDERSIQLNVPFHWRVFQYIGTQHQLPTVVSHLSCIHCYVEQAILFSQRILIEQAIRCLIEIIQRTIESVQETEVNTYIEHFLSFPGQRLVFQLHKHSTLIATILIFGIDTIDAL